MTSPTTELPVPKPVPGRTWVRYQPRHGTAYGTAHAEPTTLVLLTIGGETPRRVTGARHVTAHLVGLRASGMKT